jgi:hypothetical protein
VVFVIQHDAFLAAGANQKKLEKTDFLLGDAVLMVEWKKISFLVSVIDKLCILWSL